MEISFCSVPILLTFDLSFSLFEVARIQLLQFLSSYYANYFILKLCFKSYLFRYIFLQLHLKNFSFISELVLKLHSKIIEHEIEVFGTQTRVLVLFICNISRAIHQCLKIIKFIIFLSDLLLEIFLLF